MQLTAYRKMRTAVQSNATPGDERSLRLVQANLQQALASAGIFEQVEVEYTDDVDQLVIAMFNFPEDMSEAEVARRVERMWQDRLRYQFWEAHSMSVDGEQVELQGATRSGSNGHYVTLHLVAQRARIPAQRTPTE